MELLALGPDLIVSNSNFVTAILQSEVRSVPLVFVSVAAVLAIVAVAASAIPALRAVRLDPSIALRTE